MRAGLARTQLSKSGKNRSAIARLASSSLVPVTLMNMSSNSRSARASGWARWHRQRLPCPHRLSRYPVYGGTGRLCTGQPGRLILPLVRALSSEWTSESAPAGRTLRTHKARSTTSGPRAAWSEVGGPRLGPADPAAFRCSTSVTALKHRSPRWRRVLHWDRRVPARRYLGGGTQKRTPGPISGCLVGPSGSSIGSGGGLRSGGSGDADIAHYLSGRNLENKEQEYRQEGEQEHSESYLATEYCFGLPIENVPFSRQFPKK